ncbi:MAG: apolipoprotein N-acyltransferase, partial [Candidatus Pacebacteria bacterium]|nr:apolipoprotein N-acyltransferase [Candidatus Paceibacterota bacterium]
MFKLLETCHRFKTKLVTVFKLRLLVLFGLGGLACLALPPVGFFPILWLVFPAALWIFEKEPNRHRVFWLGWFFGLGYFVFGLYWITNAVLVGGADYLWAIPFALLGLPAFLAFFIGAVVLAWHWFDLRGWQGVLVFAIFWTLAEYVRGHVLSGLPWNLIAYSIDPSDALRQGASVVGAYGVSLAVVTLFAMPLVLLGDRRSRAGFVALGSVLIFGLVWWGLGSYRLAIAPSLEAKSEQITRLRLVQPNVTQTMGYDSQRIVEIINKLASLSFTELDPTTSAIIWPEGATESLFERQAQLRQSISQALPEGTKLITGTPRATIVSKLSAFVALNQRLESNAIDTVSEEWRYSNGLVVFNHLNQIIASYDKYHLVPFGEYIPLSNYIPLKKLVQFPADFTSGPGPRLISVKGLPEFIPMICYEGIFPAANFAIDQTGGKQPFWLLSISNDGWFGTSSGPYQHLTQTKWRGVEEGLPMVRVANSGISAVSDSFGRILVASRLNNTAVIDVVLPNSLQYQTIYAKYLDR